MIVPFLLNRFEIIPLRGATFATPFAAAASSVTESGRYRN
jgi:hypothetical protein